MKIPSLISLIVAFLAPLISMPSYGAICGGLNPVLVTTTSVVFGNYSANAANADTANGTINVFCTVQASYTLPTFTIALSAGGAGSFNPRKMSFLTSKLNYNLYTSAGYSTVWGDGTSSTATQTYNSSTGVASISFTVYGNIPTHQYVSAGLYGDTITVTVTY